MSSRERGPSLCGKRVAVDEFSEASVEVSVIDEGDVIQALPRGQSWRFLAHVVKSRWVETECALLHEPLISPFLTGVDCLSSSRRCLRRGCCCLCYAHVVMVGLESLVSLFGDRARRSRRASNGRLQRGWVRGRVLCCSPVRGPVPAGPSWRLQGAHPSGLGRTACQIASSSDPGNCRRVRFYGS